MIEWSRVGDYVPSVYDKSREIANVFQILIKQKFTLTTTGMSSIWNRNSEFPQKNSDIIHNNTYISGELCLLVELESDWTVLFASLPSPAPSCLRMIAISLNGTGTVWRQAASCLRSSRDRKWSPTVQPLMARRSTSHFYSSVTDLSGHQKRTIRPILLFIRVSLILNGQWL